MNLFKYLFAKNFFLKLDSLDSINRLFVAIENNRKIQ